MKFKKAIPYDILIRPTPNDGFIVEVGCIKVAYSGWPELIRDLSEYFENPKEVEKQYNDDIAKLGRVHISDYAPITGSGLSMLANNIMEQQRKEAWRVVHARTRAARIYFNP